MAWTIEIDVAVHDEMRLRISDGRRRKRVGATEELDIYLSLGNEKDFLPTDVGHYNESINIAAETTQMINCLVWMGWQNTTIYKNWIDKG